MPTTSIPRFELRRLFRFPLLSAGKEGGASPPRESELLFDLTGENPENRLFGRYDAGELWERLDASGLLAGLSERGYPAPALRLSCADPSDQRICLYAGEETRDRLLIEARLQLAPFHPRRPIGPFAEEFSFRMLVIHWLVLSSPDGKFTVDRPRLPGQERPGLGLLNQTIELLKAFTRELSIDGVVDVPDHFHRTISTRRCSTPAPFVTSTRRRKGGSRRSPAIFLACRWRWPPRRSGKGASSTAGQEPRCRGPSPSR
jgi:hypothetical protein